MNLKKYKKMFEKVLTKIKKEYKIRAEKKRTRVQTQREEKTMSIFGKRENVIAYTVNKEINKDMYITVQNGEVVVNAPWYFTANKIQEIVKNKKQWILDQLKEYEKENTTNIQVVKILGKNYDVKVMYKNIKTPELNLDQNQIIKIELPLKYKKMGNAQILNLAIEKMYEQIAENEIESIMEKERIILGIAPEEYEISKMKNELAKCQGQKITINPEIMKYKREMIEYLIAHEFCHLKYKTHCKKFYEMLEKSVPEYEKYQKELFEYLY